MHVNSNKILYYILASHLILWTAIPSIFNTNLPLDTIEVLAWGNELKTSVTINTLQFFHCSQRFSLKFLEIKIGHITC